MTQGAERLALRNIVHGAQRLALRIIEPGAVAAPAIATPRRTGDPESQALLARAQSENFPVAPRWLPRGLRDDLLAIYGFARLVDEAGDAAPGDRLARLDAIESDLERAARGAAQHPLLRRLTPALQAGRLPLAPFRQLIAANRRDQFVVRYADWEELLGYCALSANPVGALVLHAAGAATPTRVALSDSVCTALQVLEHCQDVAEDRANGRVYLPADELARFGVRDADLVAQPAPESLRRANAHPVARSRALLASALPLVGSLRGAVRFAVAGYAAGGFAAADALQRAHFDPSGGAPRARRRDVARHAVSILWRGRRRAQP
ncbi:MAG: squalene synthase [Deltaproteobacteria bacterium]|nr:squalene synthase [Deltaproteobacteria bacterium]